MNKNQHNQKHLTLSDRTYIEQELLQGSTFRSIANVLHKDPSTISKEIRLHAQTFKKPSISTSRCTNCRHFNNCYIATVCKTANCRQRCWTCAYNRQAEKCNVFDPFKCEKLWKPPYVCNGCNSRANCEHEKLFYFANRAQKAYEQTLYNSRKGINLTPDELRELNDLISPLVMKGQPLSHIFAVHADEIPVCRRTLYNYFDQNIFKARNIDLPRRVRYKKRKKHSEPRKKDYQQTYRNKRTYVDFERFMDAHPDVDVVEMDTVKGSRATGKCLLTLLFRSCSFMIIILLPDCTQQSVINAINNLCDTIGIRTFKKYFPVILTDNDSNLRIHGISKRMNLERAELMYFTAILMFLIKKLDWKRIMNTFVISSPKVAVCTNILRKISIL